MNIPNYPQLIKRVRGIDKVLGAPPEKIIELHRTDHHMDGWVTQTTTVGELREVLEKCTYNERYPGWLFVFPGEEDESQDGRYYQGIYDGGDDSYRANILETDYQI